MTRIIVLIIIIVSAAGYFAVERARNSSDIVEQNGNALKMYDLVHVSSPRSGSRIQSPVTIEGVARGYWFFEGDFPIKVFDARGEELGIGIAQAAGEWMTEEFVSFQATVHFVKSDVKEGVIVLYKDNPSELRELDNELKIPVQF